MGRIRSIKPEYFASPDVAAISLGARLTFVGLWCAADDHGAAPADSRLVKSSIWPLDDDVTPTVVEGFLRELEGRNMIARYDVAGRQYIQIVNWAKHQRPTHPGKPRYPRPPDHLVPSGNPPEPSGDSHESSGNPPPGSGVRDQGSGERESALAPSGEKGFEAFWSLYPARSGKKLGKSEALLAWGQLDPPERAAALIGVENYAAHCENGGPYPKDAHRWLRDRAWNDWEEPATDHDDPQAEWDRLRELASSPLSTSPR